MVLIDIYILKLSNHMKLLSIVSCSNREIILPMLKMSITKMVNFMYSEISRDVISIKIKLKMHLEINLDNENPKGNT